MYKILELKSFFKNQKIPETLAFCGTVRKNCVCYVIVWREANDPRRILMHTQNVFTTSFLNSLAPLPAGHSFQTTRIIHLLYYPAYWLCPRSTTIAHPKCSNNKVDKIACALLGWKRTKLACVCVRRNGRSPFRIWRIK